MDGSRAVRRILEKKLSRLACEVVLAGSSNQALAKLSRQRFSLISTALALPDEDGLEFIAALRQLPGYQDTPVIVVSGDAPLPPDLQAELGITAMLEKSAGISALTGLLGSLLEALPEPTAQPVWTEYEIQA